MAADARNWSQDFLIFRPVLSLSLSLGIPLLPLFMRRRMRRVNRSFVRLYFFHVILLSWCNEMCVPSTVNVESTMWSSGALFISAQSRSIVKNRAFSNESRVCQEEAWNNGEAREEEEEIGEASDDTEGEP